MSTVVGASVRRVDAVEKVTGRAKYAGDLVVPGMVHGKILRSPLAHARIAGIDTGAAGRMPGVIAVLTGKDLADIDPYYGHAIRDRPVVALDRVRFAGEPVAAVAAVDEATAEAAARALRVDYEELPVVATLEAALADGAPRLHERMGAPGLFHGLGELRPQLGNICYHCRISKGDVEAGFREAEILVEGEYAFPAVYQYAMEPHTVIAHYAPEGLTVWACCQHPYLVRAELAALYNLPINAVRIIVPFIGGGFGSKSYTKLEPITVALARKAGRPVRIVLTIDEAMVTTRRHNMRCWMRSGARRDGTLLANECKIWLDTGAYADNGPRVAATAADAAGGPYQWPHLRTDCWAVYTNTAPSGSYRAFGAAHLIWINELQVDEIARRIGMDRVEIRRRNLVPPGGEVRPGKKMLDADLVGDVQKAAAAIGWQRHSNEQRATSNEEGLGTRDPELATLRVGRGRGVACGLLAAGANPVATATIRMQADGRVLLFVSSGELGQGSRTVFSQIVAEELALPMDRVAVSGPDTLYTPYDRSTGASRSTTIMGRAVQRAAVQVRDQLVAIASRKWGLPPRALLVRDAAVCHETEALPYPELIKDHFGMVGGELDGHGAVRPESGTGSYAEGPVFWEVSVGASEVEVEPETGELRVRRLATVADAGKAINPGLVEGQDEGAALQGLGYTLFEEMIYRDGQLLNNSLVDYRVPAFADMPDHLESILVENADGPGPYGAKGVGEGAQAAIPGAVATALADAGVPMTELPLTPERVWRALRAHRTSSKP
jgi:CO/xanthine dehydrogenase Mo-binding subunit